MGGIRARRLLRGMHSKSLMPFNRQLILHSFDLFLTKPTSFREVGRLLDNWEKSGNTATEGVPHGAVTGEPRNIIEEE